MNVKKLMQMEIRSPETIQERRFEDADAFVEYPHGNYVVALEH
jgi:hypothetical protein